MAGLLLIFVLLLSFLMLNLSEIVDAYTQLQSDLYDDLEKEFEKDLDKWNAVLNKAKPFYSIQRGLKCYLN